VTKIGLIFFIWGGTFKEKYGRFNGGIEMIGGYSYLSLNKDIDRKIQKELYSQCKTINLADNEAI